MVTTTSSGSKKVKQLTREQLRQLTEIKRQEHYT